MVLFEGAIEDTFESTFETAGGRLTDPFRLRWIKVSSKDNFCAFKIHMRIGFRGYL